MAVKKDEAAGGVRALAQKMNRFARGKVGGRNLASIGCRRRINANGPGAKKIHSRLRHHDFHDGFAVAGAGNAAGFGIRVAAAANQRRIANAAGKFAAGSAGGGAGKEFTIVEAINTVPLKIEIVVAPGTRPVALNELPATEPGGGLHTMDVIKEGVQAGLIDAEETAFVQFT